jgi:aminopeptidase N
MAIGFYDFVNTKLKRIHRVEVDIDGELTEIQELVGLKRPSLILLNDDDLAYAKIRLDEKSWATALENLAGFEDSLARTLIWGAAWDATRDAEASPRDFIKLVLNNISSETESTTMLTLLRQLVTAANQFVSPEHRQAVISEVGNGLFKLAIEAEAGSDAQLQFIKFFSMFANTPELLDTLAALRNGIEKLDGLAIDADLSWELLAGLVVGGRADAAEIDKALADDNTSNGQKAAAGARAMLPTLFDKQAAWHTLTETNELSNILVDAASLGFVRVQNTVLLEPFVDQYFENAVRIWNSNTFKIAEYLIENLYPLPLAGSALAEKTKEWIEKPEIKEIPALRRILVESLSNVERALRAQERDRS